VPGIQFTFTNNNNFGVVLYTVEMSSTQLIWQGEINVHTSCTIDRDIPLGTEWRMKTREPKGSLTLHFDKIAPGSGLRLHPPDGQLDHFRRAQEPNRSVGRAKACGDDEMTVSLDEMTVDNIAIVVAAHEVLGE
jgi:hypothetical protein